MESIDRSNTTGAKAYTRLVSSRVGVVILFLLFFAMASYAMVWERIGFACFLLPMASGYLLLGESSSNWLTRRSFFSVLGLALVLSVFGWFSGRVEWLGIGFGIIAICLACDSDRERGVRDACMLGMLTLLPFAMASPHWEWATWLTYRGSAWQASALLDGLQIPNLRIENAIHVRRGELNVEHISKSWWGMEFAIAVTLFYLAILRRPLLSCVTVLLLTWSSWVCWQALRWTLWAYQVESQLQDTSFLDASSSDVLSPLLSMFTQWVGIPTILTLLTVPMIDGLIKRLFMPVPGHTMASEFALPAQLYNATVTFPFRYEEEDWTWRERWELWRERVGI